MPVFWHFLRKMRRAGNLRKAESVKKRTGQIKEIFISFLLPFCNHLYIMGISAENGHKMLHFGEQEQRYDPFDRRRKGV